MIFTRHFFDRLEERVPEDGGDDIPQMLKAGAYIYLGRSRRKRYAHLLVYSLRAQQPFLVAIDLAQFTAMSIYPPGTKYRLWYSITPEKIKTAIDTSVYLALREEED